MEKCRFGEEVAWAGLEVFIPLHEITTKEGCRKIRATTLFDSVKQPHHIQGQKSQLDQVPATLYLDKQSQVIPSP